MVFGVFGVVDMTKVNLRTLIVYVVWLFPWKGIAIVYKIKKNLDWGAIKNLKERQLVRYIIIMLILLPES